MQRYITEKIKLTGEDRTFKLIDSGRLISQVPDLATIQGIATNGIVSGQSVMLSWDGSWSSKASKPFHSNLNPKENLVLSSNVGEIILQNAFWTSYGDMGAIKGLCNGIKFESKTLPDNNEVLFRTIIPIDKNPHFILPEKLRDKDGFEDSAWLPLKVGNRQVDIYYLQSISSIVIEVIEDGLTYEKFEELRGSVVQFCSYLIGIDLTVKSCDVLLSKDESEVYQIYWYSGREISENHYHPIPSFWGEWAQAKHKVKIPDTMKCLDAKVLSECWKNYLDNEELFISIEYVLHFPTVPIEMRGALLSVALESLTKLVMTKKNIKDTPPISNDIWPNIRDALATTLKSHLPEKDPGLSILERKISNLNQPTNREKLTKPFEIYGITLTADEIGAIDKRNKLLHQGILLPTETRKARESWKEAYMIEMKIYTLINRLLLSVLNYEGPVINWGAKEPSDNRHHFIYQTRTTN